MHNVQVRANATKEEETRFAHFVVAMFDMYDSSISAGKMQIWASALLPTYSVDQLEAALKRHLADPDWCHIKPMPGTLIKYIRGSGKNATYDALTVIQQATCIASGRQSVCFADPVINAAIYQTGGWSSACSRLSDDAMRDAYLDAFRAAYERIAVSPGLHPAYLPGRNADTIFEPIGGDIDAVMRVMQSGFDPQEPLTAIYSNKTTTKMLGAKQ